MAMKAGGDGELNAEINVTPLVDVMLVLLIIFMITAPMLNTGVSLDLPKVTAQNIEDPNGPAVLTIKKAGIQFRGDHVLWKNLGAVLKNANLDTLYVGADADLPYSYIVTAMAIAKDAQITHVMMLTSPTDKLNLDDLDKNTKP
jgi:biopolymer transport protein TolR